nr:allantoate amidohydrolase [Sulfoacidibacillus ferrooxidans]
MDVFSRFGYGANGITRLAYSESDKLAKRQFIQLCENEGMNVRVDDAGNVIARRAGVGIEKCAVACGSHLDSVINAGSYDGVLGVLAGLEVVRMLNRKNIKTKYPIEVIAFTCEESTRFGVSTIGSKAMVGLLDMNIITGLTDKTGISFEEAVRLQAFDLARFPQAHRSSDDLKAFIELHIEQGPVLEQKKKQIGVVGSIAAPTRYRLIISGEAGHSGTTTMQLRKDALVGAAEVILAVEKIATLEQHFYSVGTVGSLHVYPNSVNTIPGKVELIYEFRSNDCATKHQLNLNLLSIVNDIADRRKLTVESQLLSDESPIELNSFIGNIIKESCEKRDISFLEMASGAGHDAMNMAKLCPTGMIFVPSVRGISHQPGEFTEPFDIEAGVDILYDTMLRLAEPI